MLCSETVINKLTDLHLQVQRNAPDVILLYYKDFYLIFNFLFFLFRVIKIDYKHFFPLQSNCTIKEE